MIPSDKYPAKILLFGEYSVLSGSEALAFPYGEKHGSLKYDCISIPGFSTSNKSQQPLIELYEYLAANLHLFSEKEAPDLRRLRNDLISGLYFDSSIPANYGIGSSGAISAAVYDSYFDQTKQKPLDQIIKTLSSIEAFYHHKSSGIDPLVSFLNQTIHIVNYQPRVVPTDLEWIRNNLNVYLIDSGIPGITKTAVEKEISKSIPPDYIELTNSIIQQIVRRDSKDFFESIEKLCELQQKQFASLFTPEVNGIADIGREKNNLCVKLCGSGGGGYYLLFAKQALLPSEIEEFQLEVNPL